MHKLSPVAPGEILLEEFLQPMGISQHRLAKEIGIPARIVSEIVTGRRAITADMDLRLCRFFGLSEGYWLRGQVRYDTEIAKDTLGNALTKIRPWAYTNPRPPFSAQPGTPTDPNAAPRSVLNLKVSETRRSSR